MTGTGEARGARLADNRLMGITTAAQEEPGGPPLSVPSCQVDVTFQSFRNVQDTAHQDLRNGSLEGSKTSVHLARVPAVNNGKMTCSSIVTLS